MEKIVGRTIALGAGLVVFAVLLLLSAGTSQAETDAATRIRQDMQKFVLGRSAGGEVTVEVPPLTHFSVDRKRFPGALRTELSTRAQEPLRGRVPIAVALYAGDQLVRRSVVTPYVRVSERVVVPSRDVAAGATLSAEDLVLVERDSARLPKDAVREMQFAVGMRAKRSLRKDQPFRTSQVQSIPIVERGDRVQLVLTSGPLVIQSSGKAQQAGGLGEWIRVLNVDSKRELSGRVDREGRVHVSF